MIQDLINRYQQLTIDYMDDDDSTGLTAISDWRFHYAFMDESTTDLQTYVDTTRLNQPCGFDPFYVFFQNYYCSLFQMARQVFN